MGLASGKNWVIRRAGTPKAFLGADSVEGKLVDGFCQIHVRERDYYIL